MTAIKDILNEISESEDRYIKISMDIATQISAYMRDNGWLQADLARELNKNESEISKWLSGTHNFTVKTLALIESVFHKDLIKIPLDFPNYNPTYENSFKQITNTKVYTQEDILSILNNLGELNPSRENNYSNKEMSESDTSVLLKTLSRDNFHLQSWS